MTDAELKAFKFPPLPWTHEKLGEDEYCRVAVALGYFNPKAEQEKYRPSLDHTPFLQYLTAAQPAKTKE